MIVTDSLNRNLEYLVIIWSRTLNYHVVTKIKKGGIWYDQRNCFESNSLCNHRVCYRCSAHPGFHPNTPSKAWQNLCILTIYNGLNYGSQWITKYNGFVFWLKSGFIDNSTYLRKAKLQIWHFRISTLTIQFFYLVL